MRTDNGDVDAVSTRSNSAFEKSKSGMVDLKSGNVQVLMSGALTFDCRTHDDNDYGRKDVDIDFDFFRGRGFVARAFGMPRLRVK